MNCFKIALGLILTVSTFLVQASLAQDLKFRQEIKPIQSSTNLFQDPCDIAVFAPDGGPRYLLVADRGADAIFRFTLGASGQYLSSFTYWPELFLTEPTAIAVNDDPCHPNYGQVYVGSYDPSFNAALIGVYNLIGTPLMTASIQPLDFQKISGISLDSNGNLYVSDSSRKRILKFDHADFDPSHYNASWLIDPVAEYNNFGGSAPLDVAVGKSDLVYVTHACGCFLAYYNDGTDLWGGSGPATYYTSVDAHDPNEDLWMVSGPQQSCLPIAERMHFTNRWVNMSWNVDAKTIPNSYGNPNLNCAEKAEYRRFWPQASSSSNASCYERLFVADTGNKRIAVFGEPHISSVHPNDMVAWWRFEGCDSVLDDEINQNDGTFLSGAPYEADPDLKESMVRNGVHFSYLADGIAVPDHDTLDFGTGNFTIEAWICTRDGIGTGVRDIVDKRDVSGSSAVGYALFLYDGKPSLQIGVGTIFNYISGQSVADGRWHHVAATVDRQGAVKSVNIYIDGVLATGGSFSNPLLGNISNLHDLLMGTHPTVGPDLGFTGGLDELSLYKRALQPNKILQIYKAGCAGKKL